MISPLIQAKSNEETLRVNYFLLGQQHNISGEKTSQGYRFNAQSERVINIATLNWPPYISEDLCNGGGLFQFAVAVLVSQGYQVNVQFFPWARAVKLVESGEMDILYPAYHITEDVPSDYQQGKRRRELVSLSSAFSGSSVYLVQRKGGNLTIDKDLSALPGKTIGVIRGYQNTKQFDAMMAAQDFPVAQSASELELVKWLVAERVEYIIGDPKAFNFSVNVANMPTAEKERLLNSIEFVQPALQYQPLYFAISKSVAGHQQVLSDINIAINQFEQEGEIDRLMSTSYQCSANN